MPTGLSQVLPLAEGGTGARNAGSARENLEIPGFTSGGGQLSWFTSGTTGNSISLNGSSIAQDQGIVIPNFVDDNIGFMGIVIKKTTTGDPPDSQEGLFCVNTFDHTLKFWAAGAWRTITITW